MLQASRLFRAAPESDQRRLPLRGLAAIATLGTLGVGCGGGGGDLPADLPKEIPIPKGYSVIETVASPDNAGGGCVALAVDESFAKAIERYRKVLKEVKGEEHFSERGELAVGEGKAKATTVSMTFKFTAKVFPIAGSSLPAAGNQFVVFDSGQSSAFGSPTCQRLLRKVRSGSGRTIMLISYQSAKHPYSVGDPG